MNVIELEYHQQPKIVDFKICIYTYTIHINARRFRQRDKLTLHNRIARHAIQRS